MGRWVVKKDYSTYNSVFWGSFWGVLIACTLFPFGIFFAIISPFYVKYTSYEKNNLTKKGMLLGLLPGVFNQFAWIVIVFDLFKNFWTIIIFSMLTISIILTTLIIVYVKKKNIIPFDKDNPDYYYYKFNNYIARRNYNGFTFKYEFYLNNNWVYDDNLNEMLSNAISLAKNRFGTNPYLISYDMAKSLITDESTEKDENWNYENIFQYSGLELSQFAKILNIDNYGFLTNDELIFKILDTLKLEELKNLCKKYKIENFGNLHKKELIEFIIKNKDKIR